MKHIILLISLYFGLGSCSDDKRIKVNSSSLEEVDTCLWVAEKLVIEQDTFKLDIDHHIFRISDTIVTQWYYKNDTLKTYHSGKGAHVAWVLANDSIIFGVRCANPYFIDELSPPYYIIDGNHAYFDHVRLYKSHYETYPLENSLVIMQRISLHRSLYDKIEEQFSINPDTIIVF